MCKFLAEFVFISTQLRDEYFYESESFRKAVGYLTLPPKRIPDGQTLSHEEWVAMNYYPQEERRAMIEAFDLLDLRLAEWAVSMDGDEDMKACSAPAEFAQRLWKFRMEAEKGTVKIFKAPLGQYVYRPHPFVFLAEMMRKKPIMPSKNLSYLPQMESPDSERDEPYERRSIGLQERICRGVELMVGDALSEGQSRRRVGSEGQIAQENEALRRVRACGDKGLRGFVAQVLREPKWQFADGHPNTDEGRQRCYNRVYALMKPLRRAKSSSRRFPESS